LKTLLSKNNQATANFKNMGFFSNIISATVKTVLTPVAIVKDVANVVSGKDANATKKLLESAGDDLKKAGDSLDGLHGG
jgi:hypothetical protein